VARQWPNRCGWDRVQSIRFETTQSKVIAVLISFLGLLMTLSAWACPIELPSAWVAVNGRELFVEVAATPPARSCGLSHRASIPEHSGMLFVYPSPRPLSFWMKDTEIALSIAFLDDSGRILSIQKMDPMSVAKRYRSPQPVRYALEVNQGWFARHGIDIGDIVELYIPLGLNIR
jgi:uncharacterized membrane protein (UPF0127 family)